MRTIGTLVLALLTSLGRALSAQTAIDTVRPVGTIDGIVRDTAFAPLAGITEDRLSSVLVDFEQRRRMGEGTYVTQADIDRRNPVITAELLRGIPSLMLAPGGAAAYVVASTRVGSCRTELFVDGVRLPERTTTDDLRPPKEIAGIEPYAGPPTIPPQFAGGRSSCGVVLIWTRYGA